MGTLPELCRVFMLGCAVFLTAVGAFAILLYMVGFIMACIRSCIEWIGNHIHTDNTCETPFSHYFDIDVIGESIAFLFLGAIVLLGIYALGLAGQMLLEMFK